MALETGTYLDDLVITNPTGTDAKSEGDNHLRLIKTLLKATFPNMNQAITANVQAILKAADYAAILTLLGIETAATSDQTAAEILTALLTVDGTGTLLDADLLDGNEATAFATAAQGTTADAALPKAGGQMSGNITMAAAETVDGRDLSVDGAKLDGIEALADVTDTANVTTAGALMDSEVDANIKTLVLPASTTITAAAATVLDDATVAAMVDTLGGIAAQGTGAIVRATSPTLVTPILGTPASGDLSNCTGAPAASVSVSDTTDTTCWVGLFEAQTGAQLPKSDGALTYNAATGLLSATTFSGAGTSLTGTAASLTAGAVTTNANLTGHITSTGNAAILGSFTSLQLKTALTDETGSGAAVFATSPTLVTPVLGTPQSGNLSTCTADGTNAVGFRHVPQITKVADGAPTTGADLTYAGKHVYHTSTAGTFTIPANASIAYAIGTALTFVNGNGAGDLTIAITTDTMYLAGPGTTASVALAANGVATALKTSATTWIISGTGLT